ncbi:hypothetical protein G6F62_013962 [Rhizopus arrhizus]|nr:hypothetical protein G6F62_013962 [Rhizopus arrhizus]
MAWAWCGMPMPTPPPNSPARVPQPGLVLPRWHRPDPAAAADRHPAVEPAPAAAGHYRADQGAARRDRAHERAPPARAGAADRQHQCLHRE